MKENSSIAAIVHAGHGIADGLLADFAADLQRGGWRVRGLVQQFRGSREKSATMLVDLGDGQCFPLFQNLGAGSASCSLDQTSVAAASIALRRAIGDQANLAVANRFGALEAGGGGLAAEMLAVMSEEIPLLTVVSELFLDDWRCFTGGIGTELAPQRDALEAWFAGIQHNREPR